MKRRACLTVGNVYLSPTADKSEAAPGTALPDGEVERAPPLPVRPADRFHHGRCILGLHCTISLHLQHFLLEGLALVRLDEMFKQSAVENWLGGYEQEGLGLSEELEGTGELMEVADGDEGEDGGDQEDLEKPVPEDLFPPNS